MSQMSKEELKVFIERIPLGPVSKFLEAVSKSENKTEKATAAPGANADTKKSSPSSSDKESIVRSILKKKGASAATTVSLPPELIAFAPSAKDLDSLNKATKYYLIKVRESKAGVLLAHKINVSLMYVYVCLMHGYV
jgi:hypothetical protein